MRAPLFFLTCTLLLLSGCGSSSSNSSSSSSSGISSSVSSQSSSASSSGNEEPCPDGRKVVGYFPAWQGQVEDIQYEYLSHILYSFVLPNADGSLQPLEDADLSKLQDLVSMAAGYDVKVGIAVGGWNDGDDSAFVALAADDEARARFVDELLQFVADYDLDGIDMDWEHPGSPDEAAGFVRLMQELRTALDAAEGEKFLSAAVVAQGDWAGQYIRNEVFDSVDFLNLMAYDEWLNDNHSSMDYARGSLDYWIEQRGLPREKAILGVPFYTRPNERTYREVVSLDEAHACTSSYIATHQGDPEYRHYYNGIPKIRDKAALANERACGVMMWELSQDTIDETSLLKALWEVVHDQPATYLCE